MMVFDSWAILAYFFDEPGSDRMREVLSDVSHGRRPAACNAINLAEVRYILRRRRPNAADPLLDWLLDIGVGPASADDVWKDAADLKADHAIPLGDAFALATARHHDGVLVTGDDPHFDVADELGVQLERIGA